MYKKILVPVSMKHSGDRTHKALAHAMGICDGEIVLLHIDRKSCCRGGFVRAPGTWRRPLITVEILLSRPAVAAA